MILGVRTRKLALVMHVGASVGWIGAVAASLALALVGLTSRDLSLVRAVYLTLEPVGWSTLVPFSLASLATGLIQSLGSSWGLIRHYWVLIKLLMNLFAIVLLLLYMQTLGYLADIGRAASSNADLAALRTPSPVVHAAAAIALLLVALVLSVYKPRGRTPWGQRRRARRSEDPAAHGSATEQYADRPPGNDPF